MPFLDHLEELRARLLKVVGAVFLGVGIGIWAVQYFDLLRVIKRPIEPYLPTGKLSFTSPTEPLMIMLKLGVILGLVLASPVIIYQIWAFLSPALYQREKRVLIPALIAGLLLFLAGGAFAWLFVVPKAMEVLFSFAGDALTPIVTYEKYFDVVSQLVLALGLSCELPLIIVILASLGLVTPAGLSRFRRFNVVLSAVAGAVLSPGTDVASMLMLTIPLLLLYEVGVAGAVLIHARRRRQAARSAAAVGAALLLLTLLAPPAGAQQPVRTDPARRAAAAADSARRAAARADSLARRDSLRRADSLATRDTLPRGAPGRAGAADTLRDARVGLPQGPTRRFAEEDSVMRALKAKSGYDVVRFKGDTARIDAVERTLRITGAGLTERDGAMLEADTIAYDERDCLLDARGDPRLFQDNKTLVGGGIRYDTCRRRGVVQDAFTTFPAQGTTWYVRGTIAQDSSTTRIFATSADLTSCDLPVPHYSFRARRIKWLADEIFVARPIVLYLRDVPLLWLPFIFQDLSAKGRKSGILIPRVGIADIVRTSEGYRRQLTNFGYYWAASDYYDVALVGSWFSGQNVRVGTVVNYNVLDRFLSGSARVDRIFQSGGGGSTNLDWTHRQQFSINSSLNFSLNFATQTSVVQRQTIDPRLSVQQLASNVAYQKRFRWGSMNLGGTRRQNLSDGSGSQGFPQLTLSPNPVTLSRSITWAPGLTISNDRTFRTPAPALLVTRNDGGVDTVTQTTDTRLTRFQLATPLRIGGFQWANDIAVVDRTSRGLTTTLGRAPRPGGGPADSLTVLRTQAGSFSSELDWNTGINLPIAFPNTWRIVPTLGVQNTTAGPLAIRNERTRGQWVTQGKRFGASLSTTPTLYGFLPSFLPGIARIRHSINPQVVFNYAPAAAVSRAYAEAIATAGSVAQLRSPSQMTLSVTLLQSFEGKTRPQPGDSTGASARKIRILSIQTSGVTYDFEQAKEPGLSGWTTQSVNNTFQSDLLPGFNVGTTHELFRGDFRSDTAAFSPFLSGLQANFSLSNRTVDGLLAALGLKRRSAQSGGGGYDMVPGTAFQPRGVGQGLLDPGLNSRFMRTQGFNATINYTLSRQRQLPNVPVRIPAQQNLGITAAFSPTPLWNLSWQAQYNATLNRFESQAVRLERDLHEWRASFSYQRVANGNSAFYISLGLIDIPQLKLDYNRVSIER